MRHVLWIIPIALAGTLATLQAQDSPSAPASVSIPPAAPGEDVYTRRRHLETMVREADSFLNAVLKDDALKAKQAADKNYAAQEAEASKTETEKLKAATSRTRRAPDEALLQAQGDAQVKRLEARLEALYKMMNTNQRALYDKATAGLGPSEFQQFLDVTQGFTLAERDLFLGKVIAAKKK